MKVREGWSHDYAKKKFDIELEEDHDLPQLLDDCGIGRDWAGSLTLREKFMLMWDEAAIVSATTEALDLGIKPEEYKKALAIVKRQLATQTRVKLRLGLITKEEAKPLGVG